MPVAVFRAVVCLGIAAAHFYFGALRPELTSLFGPRGDWGIVHIRFGFESFFVLAGYFLAHSFRLGEWHFLSLTAFFRRRLMRLAVPYWVAIGVGVAGFELSAALRGRDYLRPSFSEVWPYLVFLQDLFPARLPSGVYWFMAPLFQFHLLWGLGFWLVRRVFLKRGRADYHNGAVRVMVWLTGLAMLASLAVRAAGVEVRWSLAPNAIYLALGCLTSWAGQRLPVRGWLVIGWAGACAVGLAAGESRPVAAAVSSALLLWLTVARPTLPDWWIFRGLSYVGERSYSIYLTHTYIGYRVLNLPTFWGGTVTPVAALGMWLVAVVASVVFGCVFYWLVERPLARLSRTVRYRAKWESGESTAPDQPSRFVSTPPV